MSEDSGQEKTEEPTGKRLADAKKKGQIARSRELNTFMMLIASSTLLMSLGAEIGQGFLDMMRDCFKLPRADLFDDLSLTKYLSKTIVDALNLTAPVFAVLVVVAIITPISMGGWVFSWESISPKMEKMNPIKGLPKLFSMNGFVEMLKALLKIVLVFFIAFLLSETYLSQLFGLSNEHTDQAIFHALAIIGNCFMLLSAGLIFVVMIDVPYQLWHHHKNLKMSLQEIKDEMKESEGSPEVKGRIRRMQMEMSQKRMMAEVPKADVIVTNPSHYAVALKYDQNANGAPKLVAKGVDLIAAQIRNLAIGANVPLLASPPLARALYYSTDLEKEIPQGLYLAVAQVLAYVYQLKTARQNKLHEPLPPKDIKVPEDFRQE
jgi:flagellar biosynthetic protein FlhB